MDEDIHYQIGVINATLNAMTKKLDSVEGDVFEVKNKLDNWQNRLAGASVVLSVIGSVVLYLGHDLFVLIKTKLGM